MTTQATLDFIRRHWDDDVRRLALQGHKFPDVDMKFALEQIAGRQKARTKLPSWAKNDQIVYPSHLSMEQCSSEQTARYKAQIAGKGQSVVDLTAGFGVDIAWISAHFQHAVHVEQQPQLCAISSKNYRLLGFDQIEVVCGDGVDYLHTMTHADLLYIDPARRDEHGSRTYGIADCTPNILELCDEMLEKASRVMVKLSPMLDWRKAVEDLGKVYEVHIVSVNNECKELLLMLSNEVSPLKIFCVNNDHVVAYLADEMPESPALPVGTILPGDYLYEPNASIMKAGCYNLIEARYNIRQLERNSHLFVSRQLVEDFPGRSFVIERIASMNKRELKEAMADIDQANITVRNFPMSVAELRKRLKLKDGGNNYIFATLVASQGHQLFVCRKKT